MTNVKEVLDHFGIAENEFGDLRIFDSNQIERIGTGIAFDLEKGKGRVIIDYDPAYPHAVKRVFNDFPNIPETIKVTCDGGKYNFELVSKEIADLAQEQQNRLKYADILERQMELLSRISEHCEKDERLIQHIPALTHAMFEISHCFCKHS